MKDYVSAAKVVFEARKTEMAAIVAKIDAVLTAIAKQQKEGEKPTPEEVTLFAVECAKLSDKIKSEMMKP